MILVDVVFAPQACRDFLALAQAHSKRWQKALQAEREQRVRLEETLEQLAKQHNHLERAFRGAAQANAMADNKSKRSVNVIKSYSILKIEGSVHDAVM